MNGVSALQSNAQLDALRMNSLPDAQPSVDQAESISSFGSVLQDKIEGLDQREKAREVAAQFVGLAFIQPILAELRETAQPRGLFAPTDGEKRFGPMVDAAMTDRITSGLNFPLVDTIADRLMRHAPSTTEGAIDES